MSGAINEGTSTCSSTPSKPVADSATDPTLAVTHMRAIGMGSGFITMIRWRIAPMSRYGWYGDELFEEGEATVVLQ